MNCFNFPSLCIIWKSNLKRKLSIKFFFMKCWHHANFWAWFPILCSKNYGGFKQDHWQNCFQIFHKKLVLSSEIRTNSCFFTKTIKCACLDFTDFKDFEILKLVIDFDLHRQYTNLPYCVWSIKLTFLQLLHLQYKKILGKHFDIWWLDNSVLFNMYVPTYVYNNVGISNVWYLT